MTVQSLLILKQVVEERLARLKVQARLPSQGQFLCNWLQTEAVSVVSHISQLNHVNKCRAAAVLQ